MCDASSPCELRDVIAIKHGFAFSSDHFVDEGDYVLLTPGNFREEGGFRWLGEKQKYYNGPLPENFILSAGDLLVAMTEQAPGLLGSTFFVPSDRTYLHNQRLGLIEITDRNKVDAEFLHYLFSSTSVRRAIFADATGTKVKHTSPDKILGLEVALPALEEQRKIAEILRTWDDAIEACERLIERLKARQAALVHQLVFGQRRLGNYAQSNDMQKVRWLSGPADWQVVPIGSIAAERSELNRNGDSAEVLSCSKYDGFVRSLDYFKKQVFSSDLSGYKIIRRGDFGFPSNHVEEGSIGLQNLVDEGLVSPIYTVFRFDERKVDNDYAYGVLKTELYRHIFQVSTSASVDRRGSLRWSDFSTLPFPLPSIDEQRAIQAVLANGQAQIDGQVAERNSLQAQKRGLMQKLLTGEWRLKVDKEVAA